MAVATALRLDCSLLFDLNLERGTLEVEGRAEVIAGCYRRLLDVAEKLPWLPLALSASGHTLERIARADPQWLARLGALVEAGRVELVGTGDSVLVGPLVPSAVNRWNQALGRATYVQLLGRAPRVARVHAWSQGLIDAYLDAGYEGLILDWNEPRRFHPAWREDWRHRTAWTQSPSGRRIRVLWSEDGLHRSFRRAVAGELGPERCLAGLEARGGARARHAFLHAGSAEALAETLAEALVAREHGGDPREDAGGWRRLAELCEALRSRGVEFTTPQRVLEDRRFSPEASLDLTVAGHPIALGRESGGGLARWALAGWDNLGLNARCFARARELERVGGSARDWQLLCRAWGADLRGDLTEKPGGASRTRCLPRPESVPPPRASPSCRCARGASSAAARGSRSGPRACAPC